MNQNDFGKCPYCGGRLIPIWFIDEETIVRYGVLIKTGRKRRAVSHLACEICMKNQAIDDSYDGDWH